MPLNSSLLIGHQNSVRNWLIGLVSGYSPRHMLKHVLVLHVLRCVTGSHEFEQLTGYLPKHVLEYVPTHVLAHFLEHVPRNRLGEQPLIFVGNM